MDKIWQPILDREAKFGIANTGNCIIRRVKGYSSPWIDVVCRASFNDSYDLASFITLVPAIAQIIAWLPAKLRNFWRPKF